MRLTRSLFVLASSLVVSSTCLMACAEAVPGEDVGTTAEEVLSMNGLTMSALTMNSLSANAVAMKGLTANGLTTNGLMTTSSIVATLDADPLAQTFMAYVVSCALPAWETVSIPSVEYQLTYTYAGSLGLAPLWGFDGGACDTTCQQWVSACVISRVNALGQHVPLSVRGSNLSLVLAAGEAIAYPDREATYFGNVLSGSQKRYACRAIEDDQTLIGRPCGNGANVSACAIDVLGDCHSVCATHGADGWFGSCTTPTDGTFPQAVTLYRLPQ